MADVFLSYSRHDVQAATAIQRALTAEGLDVFWDQETPVGQDWDSWIRAKLAEAKVAIVLWSKISVKSPNVRHEAILARDADKILPVMIDDLAPTDFPMGLYMVQALKLLNWKELQSQEIERLTALVRRHCTTRANGSVEEPSTATSKPKLQAGRWWGAGVAIAGLAVAGVWLTIARPDHEASTLSARMEGKWRWGADLPCASGPTISLEMGTLVIATSNSRFVHLIERDGAEETQTRVLEPPFALGQKWLFSANSTSETMQVEDLEIGEVATWIRCE